MKNKFAFTLAEVLITLVIIGVVAALTIPTAIAKYQKTETASRLKKAYSTIAQSTARAVIDNGNVENWELGTTGSADTILAFFNTYMAPYLSISKPAAKSSAGGWNNQYSGLNGAQMSYGSNCVRAYLSDGSSVTAIIESNTETDKRVRLYVDINGDKKPNMLGRDIFVFYYCMKYAGFNGKIVPGGVLQPKRNLLSPSSDGANCNKNQTGLRCASVIMEDGWQIKDDYPW